MSIVVRECLQMCVSEMCLLRFEDPTKEINYRVCDIREKLRSQWISKVCKKERESDKKKKCSENVKAETLPKMNKFHFSKKEWKSSQN